ncbi:MAG: MgtC/SapB family protein [Armatimonadota bacterium]|nr:MgtC/SapB family protein [bacterium]
MTSIPFWEMMVRLVVSVLLGALIGLERETHGRPAGLRTHILVCFGSTLFALSSYVIAGTEYDPARITAQIVTGVGFLGAGTIIHQGSVIRGLTTAASIWTVAAIGVAVATGWEMILLATFASVLVYSVLSLMPKIEVMVASKQLERSLIVTMRDEPKLLGDLLDMLNSYGVQLHSLGREESLDRTAQVVNFRLRIPRDFNESPINGELASRDYVISYRWE